MSLLRLEAAELVGWERRVAAPLRRLAISTLRKELSEIPLFVTVAGELRSPRDLVEHRRIRLHERMLWRWRRSRWEKIWCRDPHTAEAVALICRK